MHDGQRDQVLSQDTEDKLSHLEVSSHHLKTLRAGVGGKSKMLGLGLIDLAPLTTIQEMGLVHRCDVGV